MLRDAPGMAWVISPKDASFIGLGSRPRMGPVGTTRLRTDIDPSRSQPGTCSGGRNEATGVKDMMGSSSGTPPPPSGGTGLRRGGSILPVVRSATLADAEALATLAGESGRPTTAATVVERLQRLMPNPAVAVLVAADSAGTVIGWLHVAGLHSVDFPPQAVVLGSGMDPSMRSRQNSTTKLGVAEQWARRHGYVDLVVRSEHARVLNFYERRGYSRWKELQVLRKPLA